MPSAHEPYAVGTADVARLPNPNIIDSFTLKSGERIYLSDLEKHGLSYVPCDYKSPAVEQYAHLWNRRQQVTLASYGETDTNWYVFKQMRGVQIMTGQPTFLPSDTSPSGHLYLMDFDIENRLKSVYPEIYQRLMDTIYRGHGDRTPCHVKTKSEGDRFSMYVPGFGKKVSYKDKTTGGMLFEFFSKNGLSRLDNRYGMVTGSLFDIPQFHVLQEVETLTRGVCEILTEIGCRQQSRSYLEAEVVETSQIGGLAVEWAQTTIEKEDGTSYTALVSQRFPTENCQKTEHRSNRKEVSFTKFDNGSVLGKCFNCGESWWEVKTSHAAPLPRSFEDERAVIERLIDMAPPSDGPTYTPRVKLKRSDVPASPPVGTLEEEWERREEDADAFLEAPESKDIVQIILVEGWTGTGKTHTYITKANQKRKRTLAPLPHTELATQAVATARELGFNSPMQILGREHNWESSGIAAIPIEKRTHALFDKNNCLLVDELKRYADKRITHRTFCETKCRFRLDAEGRLVCPHLLQFKAAADSDFLATCSPNLLFDPHLHGYLETLVNLTSEASTEERAIDAMLGTGSRYEAENPFDFAIVDDYDIDGLYTDVTLRESEFERLKKIWRGTPTGDFAAKLFKAFKQKKPRAILKRLRNAFESTVENHEEIAEALTKHVRLGRIETPERGLLSKASGRLLAEKWVRFEDSKIPEWIPVDWDAYKELTEKDLPALRPNSLETEFIGDTLRVECLPINALLSGVLPEQITPLWQKGTTPIDLLRIFLKSLGADKNAPIWKSFSAGDPPEARLTFSIPPQAPVGILPKIAMLSATTDPKSVKKAFKEQAIELSEFAAGSLPFKEGVKVFQFAEARLTSRSVFVYVDGEPTGLKPSAAARIEKLNAWAAEAEGVTAFVSFKEFTEDFSDVVKSFDIVTHFDKVAGLNFDGLKYLVVFGYPKIDHSAVMKHAKKQFSSDSEPLPEGDYPDLVREVVCEENGVSVRENRYKDPRLEKVRRQLSIKKLEQTIGRGRFYTWPDTQSIVFTSAPLSSTNKSVLFTQDAFGVATSPEDIEAAMRRIEDAEATGDVKVVMKAKGVSERTARRHTKLKRDADVAARNAEILRLAAEGKSQREIHAFMKENGWEKVYPKVISEVVYGVHKNGHP